MRTMAIVMAAALVTTCGGNDPSPASPTPATPAQVTHLAIDGAATVVELHDIQLAANAHRSGGAAPIDVTTRATWTTGDPHAATVAQGLVTGENHGTVTITAEYDGKTVDHQVTVTRREPPVQCQGVRGRPRRGAAGASAATSRPRASAARSTCLVSTRTAASSHNRSLAAAKLKSDAASPTIRSTPGDSDVACRPNARSRGQMPARQVSQ